MENKIIEINTHLSTEDLKRVLFRQSRVRLIFLAVINFIFILFIALGLIATLLSKKNNISLTNFLPVLIPVFIFSSSLFFLIWTIIKQAKQMGDNVEETKYIFNEQGLETESAFASVKVFWAKFYKIKETKTDFLLYTQKNIAIPIPKHFFASDNQIIEFRNLINKKLGIKAKLKN